MSTGQTANIIGSILDSVDTSKIFSVNLSGSTTGTTSTLSFSSTVNRVYTIPDATTTLVGTDTTQALTGKTINSSLNTLSNIANSSLVNSSISVTAGTGLTGGGSVSLGSTQTINLSVPVSSTNGGTGVSNSFNITLGGAITTAGAFTTSGANSLTLTTTGATNVTFPTSGTLLTSATAVTTFQTSLSGLTPNSATSGAITLAGILDVTSGGTGSSIVPTNGQLLVGNGTNFTVATVTSGTGISTTVGAGTFQINNTGVTSNVAGTGISVSGATGAVTVSNTGVLSIKANAGTAETGAITFLNGTNVSIVDSPAGTFTINVATGAGGVTTFSAGTTGLTPSAATSGAVTLAGTLIAANGGTGFSSYTIGDLIYAGTSTTFTKLSDIATGNVLLSGGVGVAPSYGKVSLTTAVSGVLPIANGGTNSSTALTNNRIMVSSGGAIVVAGALTNGQLLIGSTGAAPVAASITGTTNQVTVTNGTGAITLSTPSTFIAPGSVASTSTLAAGTLFSTGTSATVSAAGTTQGTATVLSNSYNIVTTAAANSGVQLPVQTAGMIVTVVNKGANTVNVYPSTGDIIDSAAVNAAVTIPVNGTATYQASSTTQWYTTDPVLIAGTGVTLTYGNGQTTITAAASFNTNFWSTVAVAVSGTTAVGYENAETNNTTDVTKNANTNTTFTMVLGGLYRVYYGIWNTTASAQSYYCQPNGAGSISNSAVSASDSNSMTTVAFIHRFTAGDTLRLIATGTVTNTAPSVTSPLATTTNIIFNRIGN